MPKDNLTIIREAYAAYTHGDVTAVFALMHPDIEIRQTPLLPWGGRHRGHEGARAFFATLAQHTEGRPEPTDFIEAGDDVIAIGRLRGRARATGKPYDLAIVHRWTLREGKVTAFEAFIDTPRMLAALKA